MSKASDAAAALEDAFIRSAPANKKKRLSEAEWTQSLKKFHTEASGIRQRYSLGVIGRARAAYLLQQRLLGIGFHADVVRKVVFSLVLNSFTGGK